MKFLHNITHYIKKYYNKMYSSIKSSTFMLNENLTNSNNIKYDSYNNYNGEDDYDVSTESLLG